jgi:DNA repair ATPase RecN
MLRLLSIRNFVVVEALELELREGFSVLTGETGAGKSILLDALGLLLGDRFELRQLRPGADRAELAAEFDVGARSDIGAWLDTQDLAEDERVAAAAPHARQRRPEPRVDQRQAGHARAAEGDRRASRRPPWPACAPVADRAGSAAHARRRVRRVCRARARDRERVA